MFDLEHLVESKGRTRLYVVFYDHLKTYRGWVYTDGCHIYKCASDSELSTLCLNIDSKIQVPKWIFLQFCSNYFSQFFQMKKKYI